MRFRFVTTSFILHVIIFIMAMVSLPWLKKDFEIPQPIQVEFVEIDKVAQTTKPAPKPPEPKPPEPVKEEPPKPPPAPKNTAEEAVVPVKKEPEKKEEKPQPKKEATIEKKEPDKKPEKKKEEKKEVEEKPQRDFSSVLKNLDLDEEKKPAPQEQTSNAPVGEKMTMREEDALRAQLEKCWNVPFGAKDAENLVVEILMVIRPDRTLQSAEIKDKGKYNSDSFFRAAADSAMRAVQNPLCSPFALPPDKYDTWKETTVTFNPKNMF